MSTQNARDTHFFLAGWNGHLENPNATTHFQQAMKSAPTPTTPLAAEPTPRSDAETMARAETAARFLLGWKYGQMPTNPDTPLRLSVHAKAQWAWNAACKLLRFIDGSAPDEVQAIATEPMGPAAPAAQAVEPAEYPAIDPALFSGNGALWALIYAWSDEDSEANGRSVDEHIMSMMRAYVDADRTQRAAPAPAAVAVPWENFPAFLIDHCEGDIISEEGLQSALAAMLADPQYAALAATPPAQAIQKPTGTPADSELKKLSDECMQMPGGLGMHYLNYGREILSRWGSAQAVEPAAQEGQDARVPCKPIHPKGMTSVNAQLAFNQGWVASERHHGIRPADVAVAIAAQAAQGGAA